MITRVLPCQKRTMHLHEPGYCVSIKSLNYAVHEYDFQTYYQIYSG